MSESEATMPTPVPTMTDAELDDRLARLYRQHLASSPTQRGAWHALIVVILAEQKRRRDEWLSEGLAHVEAGMR